MGILMVTPVIARVRSSPKTIVAMQPSTSRRLTPLAVTRAAPVATAVAPSA
jgi:hypothetical protein